MSNDLFLNNTFYVVKLAMPNGASLQSSGTFVAQDNAPYGSAFLSPYNSSSHTHRWSWQFFPSPSNDSQYVIRSADSYGSAPSWLNAVQQWRFGSSTCEDYCSQTTAAITNITDASSFWSIIPSGNGQTYYLSNAANGSDWYLSVDSTGPNAGSWLNMNNAGSNRTWMSFELSSVGQINNPMFSTLASSFSSLTSSPSSNQPLSSSVPSSATVTALGSPASSGSTTSRSASTNVGAAVGGAIAGFVVLILLVLGVLCLRKRSRRRRGEPLPGQCPIFDLKALQEHSLSTDLKDAPTESQISGAPMSRHKGFGNTTGLKEAPEESQIFEAPMSSHKDLGKAPPVTGHDGKVYELEANNDDATTWRRNPST